ncbi:DUF2345 domain-containing protein, partial [Rhodovulum sulfidophilum]|uniref:DUF2345 domain-containing protein n=2 Tax=Rhodovulum sulfidophilum TaxID=35806 RepID=UPI001F3B0F26
MTTVGKDMAERVAGNHDMTVADSQSVYDAGRVDLTAEQAMTLTSDKTQEIYAGEAIVLNCGGASLVITEKGRHRDIRSALLRKSALVLTVPFPVAVQGTASISALPRAEARFMNEPCRAI